MAVIGFDRDLLSIAQTPRKIAPSFGSPDVEKTTAECPWYARGHCKHGRRCRYKHVKKRLCMACLAGFCPRGSECPDGQTEEEPTQQHHGGRGERGWACRNREADQAHPEARGKKIPAAR